MSLSASLNLSRNTVTPTVNNSITINSLANSETSDETLGIKVPPKTTLRSSSGAEQGVSLSPANIEPSAPLPAYPVLKDDDETSRIQQFEHRLLELILITFSNDLQLIQHVIEPGKNIILCKTDLIELIQILTGSSRVAIETEPVFKGCTYCKEKLFDSITKILVNGCDFYITANKQYNLFSQYHVSLDECFW